MGPLASLAAKLAMGAVAKLMTEKFLGRLLVEGFRYWAKQTENPYDDRVAEAAADAFGVPKEALIPAK